MVLAALTASRAQQRARDWVEIQERMLVPLYEAVYRRLDVGPATSVLGLGCGSGLALLLAATRGAPVTGLETDRELGALARDRHLRVLPAQIGPDGPGAPGWTGGVGRYGLVTAFDELAWAADPGVVVKEAADAAIRGGYVALAAWGPPERCDTAAVLSVARRLGPGRSPDPFALSTPGTLEQLAQQAGLRLAGGGRVNCPFAYPDPASAVRGLLSTGLFDAATDRAGESPVEKELQEALHPYLRGDGSVRMANVFRYVLADSVG
jgi:SAM-dependent methyltransferase